MADPALAHLLQCEGTWFVGLDALNNDALGRINGQCPLSGPVVDFIRTQYGALTPLHPAQVSVVYPGYPRPRAGEGEGAFLYRQRRDAAHVDGILRVGPARRRQVREPHAWILGLPLTSASPDAAPLVVWEGSHDIMRRALSATLADHHPKNWKNVDITESYQAARREVFETCPRVSICTQPGEAVLLHRLALHGIAPWGDGAQADEDGRMIAYFRPPMPGGVRAWLAQD